MSLSRISKSSDLLKAFSCVLPAANAPFGKMQCIRYAVVHGNPMNLHVTSVRRYPNPPTLPLPTNVSEIFANETGRFTPERARDIAGPVLLYNESNYKSFFTEQPKMTEAFNNSETYEDMCVDSYDCFGAVNLKGTMQSNVPKPYSSNGKSTHLNMPGGQWARDDKYIAEDMQKSHYRSVHLPLLKLDKSGLSNNISTNILLQTMYPHKYIYSVGYSTSKSQATNTENDTDQKPDVFTSKKERFKRLVKDYGITVTIFHVLISLVSLGTCYVAVLSGTDLTPFIEYLINENSTEKDILLKGSTFLVAYGIHKLLMPVRIGITCAITPILVQRLRRLGILKRPKINKLRRI